METILNNTVDPADLIKFRRMYEEQSSRGVPSEKAQFEYAICLVRSKSNNDMDIKHGIALFEDLFKRTKDNETRRDCLYYLAFAYTRIKDYQHAMKYTESFLKIEPLNHQVQDLQKYIKNNMRKEGLVGMAIVGGAALAPFAQRKIRQILGSDQLEGLVGMAVVGGAALALGGLIGFGVAVAKKL